MSKEVLTGKQEVSDAYVNQAAGWASALVQRESVGPGDLDNAMRRLEARYGVSYSTLWALRYRRPKDMLVSAWFALKNAYEAECERQMRRLKHEIEITRRITGSHSPAVSAAEALVGEKTSDE